MLLGGMMGEMFQKEESSSTDGGVMALRVTKKKPQLTRICFAASTADAPGRSTPAKGEKPYFCIYPFSSLCRNCFNK